MTISKFQIWVLKKIFKKTIIQGYAEKNLTVIYKLMHDAAEETFCEDNVSTLDNYLRYCFSKSSKLYIASAKGWNEGRFD